MTLEELERGLELHERRLASIEGNFVVQGELLNRVDQRLDRLANLMEESERRRTEDRETLRLMQAAMSSLFQRMDAFIRGLARRNGDQKPRIE